MTTKTEIGQCKDCKWWEAGRRDEFGRCHKLLKKYGFHNQWPKDPVKCLETEPDFGCIHWEEKDGK